MARLQDFNTVTPTSSDKLLIVQPQGQGLATIEAVVNKSKTEITSQITFAETVTGTNTRFYFKNGILYIFYQGESKAHSAGDVLFTLPSGYRPTALIYMPIFATNGVNFITGDVSIQVDGVCKVSHISSTTGVGRIYFSVAIPIT